MVPDFPFGKGGMGEKGPASWVLPSGFVLGPTKPATSYRLG
jgi:hypothetical protein